MEGTWKCMVSPAALLMFEGLNPDRTFWGLTEFALKQEQEEDFTAFVFSPTK